MKKKIKLGIIGAGRIGKLHAENVVYNINYVELKSISDLYADKVKDWAYGLGIKEVYEDYKKILNDPEIDAVMICSSTDTHSQIAIEAAKAGKHIFCEKPIDHDLDRIKLVLDEVKKSGVKLQIGFNRRFDHNFKRVHDIVKEGKIGDPQIIKITSRDPGPPPIEYVKVSGGIFLDMTIHDFDMIRYLSGSEVTEVYTSADVLIDPAIGAAGDVDTAVITLRFKSGAIGIIINSRKAIFAYDQRVEIFGSKGTVSASNDYPNTVVVGTDEGIYQDKPKYFFLERYKESFIDELKEFFDAIKNNKETPVTGIDGLKPVIIGLAAKKSYMEGRPVKLDE